MSGICGRDQLERPGALLEQVPSHLGPADGHENHPLVVPVAELVAKGLAVTEGRRVEVERVAGEPEVLPRPRAHVREIGPELAIEHVGLVADHDRQIAHVGMVAQVVDVLGVLLPAADELRGGPVVPHRKDADEVGEEDVRRPLELGVLVEVVVEVPALVTDPQVVGLSLHDVRERHEVRRHDLVHVPEGVEGMELVIGRPALEVRALVLQESRRRMEPFAPVLDDAVGGIGGQEVDDDVRMSLAQPAGDREVALDVAEADRAREPQHPALAPAPRGDGASARDVVRRDRPGRRGRDRGSRPGRGRGRSPG